MSKSVNRNLIYELISNTLDYSEINKIIPFSSNIFEPNLGGFYCDTCNLSTNDDRPCHCVESMSLDAIGDFVDDFINNNPEKSVLLEEFAINYIEIEKKEFSKENIRKNINISFEKYPDENITYNVSEIKIENIQWLLENFMPYNIIQNKSNIIDLNLFNIIKNDESERGDELKCKKCTELECECIEIFIDNILYPFLKK